MDAVPDVGFLRTATAHVLATHPEWRQFASSGENKHREPYVVVEVPAPEAADVRGGLRIIIEAHEVTVAFDAYHSHFDEFVLGGDQYGNTTALDFVAELLAERAAVASWWLDDTWVGSTEVTAGALPGNPPRSPFNRIRIRSWMGTHNRDVVS